MFVLEVGVADGGGWADAQPAWFGDGAVVQWMVGAHVNPADGGEFAPAGAGVGGQQDQGAVAGVDGGRGL